MSLGEITTENSRIEQPQTVRVWDPLVRLFHWSLVAAFVVAYATGDEWEKLHVKVGYVVIALVAFRLIWGLIGSKHARFVDFIYRPSKVIAFLKDSANFKARRYLGHNPAGGAMVVALLILLSAIGTTGYMMTMDAYWGVEWVADLHEALVTLSVILVGLHIAGVLFASYEQKENLVQSMLNGRKAPLTQDGDR